MATQTANCDVRAMIGYAEPLEEKIVMYNDQPERDNLIVTPHEFLVRDVRTAGIDCFDMSALGEVGFAYVKHEGVPDLNDQVFADNSGSGTDGEPYSAETVKYLDSIAQHIKSTTGAREVLPQLYGLLSRASKRGGKRVFHKPAGFTHIDYTTDYAEKQVPLALGLAGVEAKPYSKFILYQTWRAISGAPQDSALAVCDIQSVELSDEGPLLHTILPIDPPENVVHTRLPKYNPAHRWYYLSDMEPDDLMIFPAYDSTRPGIMSGAHVAFDNPLAGDEVEPRRSIEARFIALFD